MVRWVMMTGCPSAAVRGLHATATEDGARGCPPPTPSQLQIRVRSVRQSTATIRFPQTSSRCCFAPAFLLFTHSGPSGPQRSDAHAVNTPIPSTAPAEPPAAALALSLTNPLELLTAVPMSCTGQLLPQALAPRPSEQTPAAIPAPPPPPPPQRTMQLYSRLGKIASKPAPVLKRQQHNSLARLVALLAPRGDRGARHTRSAPERPTESGSGSRWRLSVIVMSRRTASARRRAAQRCVALEAGPRWQ